MLIVLFSFLPEQKLTYELRIPAYGASADQLDELIRIGEFTTLEALKTFCSSAIHLFGLEYLRKPTQHDLEPLLSENAAKGFPGMIVSLDCMHWAWKIFPTAWAGAYRHKEKVSTVILEAVASRSLWIWHAFFGTTGSNNDLNVFERSPSLDDLVNHVETQVSFSVNGAMYDHAYYLTDESYPAWAIFQQSIRAPEGRKRQRYASVHEAVQKTLERAFGFLQKRFRILALPCKVWSPKAIGDVILACILLHNMVIGDELDDSPCNHDYLFDGGWVSPAPPLPSDTCPVTNITQVLKAAEDDHLHYELKNVEH
ncbi:unnamed protein product [Phytophthora fragariaefolia]|uniref:Unnamed protein product n=1 Tax=Phytophthora fragariaefolia TaxID=1490495 RepID=A0A9W6UB25_9STRA|nr:unnamed protein product [Phytophthora fragariaefolia]